MLFSRYFIYPWHFLWWIFNAGPGYIQYSSCLSYILCHVYLFDYLSQYNHVQGDSLIIDILMFSFALWIVKIRNVLWLNSVTHQVCQSLLLVVSLYNWFSVLASLGGAQIWFSFSPFEHNKQGHAWCSAYPTITGHLTTYWGLEWWILEDNFFYFEINPCMQFVTCL